MMTQRAIMPLTDFYCYLMCVSNPSADGLVMFGGIRPVVKAPTNSQGKMIVIIALSLSNGFVSSDGKCGICQSRKKPFTPNKHIWPYIYLLS